MKKFLLSIVFVCLSATMIHAQNLITNGGFETWTSTETFPDNWAAASSSHWGLYFFYNTDATQGNVLRLADLTSSSVAARRFNTTADFSISANQVYRVTFKVKGNVGLRGLVLVKGTTTPSTTTASATNHIATISDYPSGTNVADWTTLQYDITVPGTATAGIDYRLHFSWSSSATLKPTCDFMIDDISLVLVSPTTSVQTSKTALSGVYANNGKIVFNNADNTPFNVFNINGAKITEVIANHGSTLVLPKGVYIVKTQEQAVKVVL